MIETFDEHVWEARFRKKIESSDLENDPAHDLAHFERVVRTAREIAARELARFEVVLPAAWLHDLVNVPKNDPRRAQASRLSAQAALVFLRETGYPEEFHADIAHAIEAHSFSAEIEPLTLEARIVQDADRLDGLGAIGIARCFAVGGRLGRPFYDPADPWAKHRPWDDTVFTGDHFYVKLFKTAETLKTEAGRAEGHRRVEVMRRFLRDLGEELR